MKPNRPHFHVWLTARGGRIRYRLARGFWTKQAAHQWAARRYKNEPWRTPKVEQCTEAKCAPKLD